MDELLSAVDAIERTRANIVSYQGPFEMTNLLNNMKALLISLNAILPPGEPGIWATAIDRIQPPLSCTVHLFEPIQYVRKGTTVFYPKTLRVLVQKLRNGFAHDRLEAVNQNRSFVAVIVRNLHDPNGSARLDTEVQFTYDQLKTFGLFVADKYLDVRVQLKS